MFNKTNLKNIIILFLVFFGTAGFGAGYHFSYLASSVEKEYRGRVFALGYALGSVGAYLMVLLPESFYASIKSLLIYIPALLLNLYFVVKHTSLIQINEEKQIIY